MNFVIYAAQRAVVSLFWWLVKYSDFTHLTSLPCQLRTDCCSSKLDQPALTGSSASVIWLFPIAIFSKSSRLKCQWKDRHDKTYSVQSCPFYDRIVPIPSKDGVRSGCCTQSDQQTSRGRFPTHHGRRHPVDAQGHSFSEKTDHCRQPEVDRRRGGEVLASLRAIHFGFGQHQRDQVRIDQAVRGKRWRSDRY